MDEQCQNARVLFPPPVLAPETGKACICARAGKDVGNRWMWAVGPFEQMQNMKIFKAMLMVVILAAAPRLASGQVLKWAFLTGGAVNSSPAIGDDGTIYVGSNDKKVYAINPDGTTNWVFATGGAVVSSPVIGADGTIYVGSLDYHLYAINPDGSLLWAYPTFNSIRSSPALDDDGIIYFGSDDNRLYALRPDSSKLWEFLTAGDLLGSPMVAEDGTIYIGSTDGTFYGVTPDGAQRSSFRTGNRIDSSPALGADGTVFLGSRDNHFYAFTPGSGTNTVRWNFLTRPDFASSPAVAVDGTAYTGGSYRRFFALNTNGVVKWTFTARGRIYSSPAIGPDGTIYIGADDKLLYAVNPNGTKRWTFATRGYVRSSPAVGSDGTVYVGSTDRKLYAIQGTGSSTNIPWAMFRKDVKHAARSKSGKVVITSQPASQTVIQGGDASFSVAAEGVNPLTYQWRFNGTKIPTATNTTATNITLTVTNVQPSAGGHYDVVVGSALGSVTSSNATLTVPGPPLVTLQPTTRSVNFGNNTTFTVIASGSTPLAYQWRLGGAPLSSATNGTLTITNAQVANGGSYDVVITNFVGSTTSQVATLTVIVLAPGITTQPASRTTNVGSTVIFTVAAAGIPAPTFQWRFGGANIGNATNASLTLTNVQLSSAGNYDAVAANFAGSATSAVAVLTVQGQPTISQQPTNQSVNQGDNATFVVVATGVPTPDFRWRHNGSVLSGATSATLTLTSVLTSDAGAYDVIVSNAFGFTSSQVATLTVAAPSPPSASAAAKTAGK